MQVGRESGARAGLWVALLLVATGGLLALPGQAEGPADELSRARDYEARLQAVIAKVSSSVVTIALPGEERAIPGAQARLIKSGGSGVVIGAEGYVLTCDHVVDEGEEVLVGLADGRTLTGVVLGRDAIGDVALIKVETRTPLTAAVLGDSRALRAGDPVLALGNPFGLARDDHAPAVSLGIVSALHRSQGGEKIYGDAIQVDAAVNPGNSGGPLFDLEGRLVGINGRISIRSGQRYNVGVGFSIPIHQVIAVLPDLRAGKDVRRGWLGLRFQTASHPDGGAVVDSLTPGGPAAQAGLRVGDRIVSVDGEEIEQPLRFKNAISLLPEGATIQLVVVRGAERLELRATLSARPQAPR